MKKFFVLLLLTFSVVLAQAGPPPGVDIDLGSKKSELVISQDYSVNYFSVLQQDIEVQEVAFNYIGLTFSVNGMQLNEDKSMYSVFAEVPGIYRNLQATETNKPPNFYYKNGANSKLIRNIPGNSYCNIFSYPLRCYNI